MLRNLSLLVIALLLLSRCNLSPVYDTSYAAYSTDHFRILYKVSDYSIQEIMAIAEKKERLLSNINKTLNLNFNKIIDTYLYLYSTKYAYTNLDVTHESWAYVMDDDGHEIAHVVTFNELGRSNNHFLVEGIAVFSELKLYYYNIIEEFISYSKSYHPVSTDKVSIKNQILDNTFTYSYYSYRKAGAFLKYLSEIYGVEKVKEIYVNSITRSSTMLESDFVTIFNKSIDSTEKEFLEFCFPDTTCYKSK